jgi:serine/threonine protein phosphatase PrpC
MRHVLTNALGAREETEIHVAEHALSGGETLLLCSDGLHTVCSAAQLQDLLMHAADARAGATRLVRTALDAGARDNVTAVVIRTNP